MSLTQEQILELLPNSTCRKCGNPLFGSRTAFCSKTCKDKFYQNNSYESQQARGLKRKLALIKMKGGECEKCGYKKNIAALEFHHRDETTKKFRLDIRNMSNRSFEKLLEEINKCDLLCANCHREEHNPGLDLVDLTVRS